MTTPAPRRRDPEARRREILTAATELVIENGPAALTHRAVAKRAQVPLGSTTQHFTSIDELRETALRQLADEVETALDRLEPSISQLRTDPEPFVAELHRFLCDQRSVRADLSLITTATTDPHLRELALRWFDRLTEMLAAQLGHDRALTFAIYFDGATVHAGLHERPLSKQTLVAAIQSLITDSNTESTPE